MPADRPKATRGSQAPARRTGVPIQSSAIPFRFGPDGETEVLLVTSRTHRRWIFPKGRIAKVLGPSSSAEREAYEEAGVRGLIGNKPIATYRQFKLIDSGGALPLTVAAYTLEVDEELLEWPEKAQRKRRWVTLKEARRLVQDEAIKRVLRKFEKSERKQRRKAASRR